MNLSQIFRREKPDARVSVQTARQSDGFLSPLELPVPCAGEAELFERLRASVPIIDAAVQKIVRLTVDFAPKSADPVSQRLLDDFAAGVPVGSSGRGLGSFAAGFLDSLLTCGTAVGEAVLTPELDGVAGLYLPPLSNISLRPGRDALDAEILAGPPGRQRPLECPGLVWHACLNPAPGELTGRSLLSGLPFLSEILMKVYEAVGNNFQRIGSLRYAVTYRPDGPADRAAAREIADSIAKEWSEGMSASARGEIRDFVAVGDVDVRVIGADNQYIDTSVPVRQLLEQIVAKLGLPPFLLGLSWSTTERMSRLQADILTTELESYRRLLEPVLREVCGLRLRAAGRAPDVAIEWGCISLQDETELAAARLSRARAQLLERQTQGGKEA